MPKRTSDVFELVEQQVSQPDRKEELIKQLRSEVNQCLWYTEKSLAQLVSDPKELKQVLFKVLTLNNPHTVHKKHPHIRKVLNLEFKVTPAEMAEGERCLLHLDTLQLEPSSRTELVSGKMRPSVDTSRFVPHKIRLYSGTNECPFHVVLKSNLWTMIREYMDVYNSFAHNEPGALDRLMGAARCTLPELPGEAGFTALKPQFSGEIPVQTQSAMNPFSYLIPENARTGLSVRNVDALINGIYFIELIDPQSGRLCEYGLLSATHVLGTYAYINWQHYNISFTSGSKQKSSDRQTSEKILLLKRSLLEEMAKALSAERQEAVPLVSAEGLVFELARYVNPGQWSSMLNCVPDTTGEDMQREYRVHFELELEYTLFDSELEDYVISAPAQGKLIPTKLNNLKQIEEKLRAEAAYRLRREKMEVDLANV
jgi:hypothetical protein